MGMDFIKRAKVVRFRSHHNKYLLADDDEVSVWQNRDGTVNNARWTVELIDGNPNRLRLKSCYGKYLTALTAPPPCIIGMKSKVVFQTLPKTLDSVVEWEAVREGFKVKLKAVASSHFLRANGCGVPPWKYSVSHDIPHKRSTLKEWFLWDMDVVETRTGQQPQKYRKDVKNENDHQEPPRAQPPITESSQTQPDIDEYPTAEVDLASPPDKKNA